MDKRITTEIAQYISVIKEKYQDFEQAYLFGSYAKNNESPESDIDIALIFNKLNDNERFDIQVQLMLIASDIDTRIEPHPISKKDFNSGNPFANEIMSKGIEL